MIYYNTHKLELQLPGNYIYSLLYKYYNISTNITFNDLISNMKNVSEATR